MKRQISSTLMVFFALALISGCDNDDDLPQQDNYTVSASMTGAQEVPAVATTATGTVTGTYNATTNALQYNISWSGLSGTATVGHFHGPALAGVNASPVIHYNLLNNGTGGSASATVTLTDAQEVDFLAGKWYANVHTAANTGGEIRGQVSAVK